jgi:hypothetical protein
VLADPPGNRKIELYPDRLIRAMSITIHDVIAVEGGLRIRALQPRHGKFSVNGGPSNPDGYSIVFLNRSRYDWRSKGFC